MNIVLNVTETERWSVLTQCIDGELCLSEELESKESNGTYVLTDICQVSFIEEALSNKNIETLIVFYQQAEYFIAESVRSGARLAVASEKWTLNINQLNKVQRENRSRIKLINIEQA
ncbi:MAG: hypothetical protein ACW7DN_11665, partial [Paraglaciecola chathamensis]